MQTFLSVCHLTKSVINTKYKTFRKETATMIEFRQSFVTGSSVSYLYISNVVTDSSVSYLYVATFVTGGGGGVGSLPSG